MIWRLHISGRPPQDPPGIVSGRQDYFLKKLRIDVVRTTKGGQCAPRLEQFQGAQVNLLVTAQRIRHRRPVPGERRRIQDDQVKTRYELLVRSRDRLRLEPVENISRFE